MIDTIKVKNPNDEDGGFMIINASDYDPKKHQLADGQTAPLTAKERAIHDEDEAKRRVQANRGVAGGGATVDTERNPSGTFSEPTPTDIRYPNKDATEFENNHGAYVGKSAAGLRDERGMEQKPGGLRPERHEKVKEAEAALNELAQDDDDAAARNAAPEKPSKPAKPAAGKA